MREKIVSFLKNMKKTEILAVSICMVLTAVVTGSLAYLKSETLPVENTFELVEVPNEVYEKIEGNVKKEVGIVNTSISEPAYIRAKVVATWVKTDAEGKPTDEIYGAAPVECSCSKNCSESACEEGCGYDITWNLDTPSSEEDNTNQWVEGNDGYYYYKEKVEAGKKTDILFTDCKVCPCADILDGYSLSIEIMGQSIQADGTDAEGKTPIELAWGEEAAKLVGAISNTSEGGNK